MLRKISTSLKGAARLADRRHRSRDVVLPGLKDVAEIAYDAHGIPFISAWSQADLFEVQGFACATDRLFQLIYLKHVAAGRVAELFGDRPLEWRDLSIHFRDKTVVDLDYFLRCLGLARAASESLKALSRDSVVALEAYARGVNAAIDDQKRRGLPPEFVLLGLQPEPWSPVDSVSILKLLAFQLNYSWRNILMLDHLSKRLSPEKARVLMPHVHPDSIPIIHGPSAAPESQGSTGGGETREDGHEARKGGNGASVSSDLLALDVALRDLTGLGGPGQGSNCWAVSGALTDTGHPFLCNDPHLPTTVPGPWFSVRLKGGGIDVTGAAVPGLPGVLIGHNRDVAWGITLTCADDGDIYVERTDPEHPNRCQSNTNEWRDMTVRDEEIRVKGAGSVKRTVRETHHGPVISDLLTTPRAEGEVYAFRWTALGATCELDGAIPAMRARTGDELIASLRKGNGAPALNVSWADRAGNIGYGLVGLIPIRRGWKGTTPVPGFDGSREWEGFVPANELPTFKNPAAGYVVTANHRVTDEHYPYYISDFFEPHHRHRRIVNTLAEKSAAGQKLSIADMEALQADSHSLWAHDLVASVIVPWIKEARPVDPDLLWAAHELETWDGTASASSRAATVFYPFIRHLVNLVLKEDMSAGLINIFLEATNLPVIPIVELLSNRSNPFWRGKDRNLIFHRALVSTLYELRARLGRDRSKWTWGRLHQLWLKHPLHAARPMRPLFSVGPFEGSGDGMTVNCGYMSHAYGYAVAVAPSMRFIADVGDWSRSRAVTLAGQSGRPQSRHYRDQTALWRANEYRAVPFDAKPKGAIVTIRPTKR